MIHIFENSTVQEFVEQLKTNTKFLNWSSTVKFAEATQKYIAGMYFDLLDEEEKEKSNISMDEYLSIVYLASATERVAEDKRILPVERSLLRVIDKLEEDLMYAEKVDTENATILKNAAARFPWNKTKKDINSNGTLMKRRAGWSFVFIEADILHKLKDDDETATLVLGKIKRIKNKWLVKNQEENFEEKAGLKPAKIKSYIDQYVIGQEDAKKIISTAIYGHMKRIWHPDVKFASNVVLLIGPSGSGKTEIMRKVRDLTKLPMVFTDVSSLGASQYRGRHKEDVLISLWEEAGRNINAAENGIIFMDEFDKLLLPAFSEKGVNMHDDVQAQLLTMLEGSEVELKVDNIQFTLNTSNVLFVLAGAFQGIEDYIRADKMKKDNISGNIGFMSLPGKEIDVQMLRRNINHDVLIEYGMKRELAGRISNIAVLEKLDKDTLIRIMKEPKDSILERYAREFELSCGAKLEFEEEALEVIADKVLEQPIGARALYSIIRSLLKECLFKAPGYKDAKKILVTKKCVIGEEQIQVLY